MSSTVLQKSSQCLENTDAFTKPPKHFTASPPTSLARAEGEQAGMTQRHRGHCQLNSVLSPTPLPYSSGPQHRSPDSRISLDTHVQMETNPKPYLTEYTARPPSTILKTLLCLPQPSLCCARLYETLQNCPQKTIKMLSSPTW